MKIANKITSPRGKKPLYFGDPTATLTICVKKMRRHVQRDIRLMVMPGAVESEQGQEDRPRVQVVPVCKHCKQDPRIR
jgi:hypothetical protein